MSYTNNNTSRNWAFEALNALTPSPGASPANGPEQDRNDLTLSFPCDGSALQQQLEQWTNTSFNFDSPTSSSDLPESALSATGAASASATTTTTTTAATLSNANGIDTSYAFGLGSDVDIEQLLAPPSFGSSFVDTDSLDYSKDHIQGSSLVDPALHLPIGSAFSGSMGFQDRVAPGLLLQQHSSPALVDSIPISAVQTIPSAAAPSPAKSTTKKAAAAAAPKKRKTAATATPATTTSTAVSTAASTPAPSASGVDTPKPIVTGTGPGTDADEAANQLAIEEDKRRRNTAASARFRVKKKQREQALEQTAKELKDRVAQLEGEVEALKKENGWLKGLIVEKPADESGDVESKPAPTKKRSAAEISA